ncbi:TPA: hypothetical protein ACGCQG_005641, partial [Escherichia coli]
FKGNTVLGFKRNIAPCNACGWRFIALTVVTLRRSPLQLNVDKQNSPSVRRVLREKQGEPDAPEGG